MSTLSLHAPHVPRVRFGLARVRAVLAAVLDVFTEAQLRAIAAHKKYPFADW